MRNCCYSYALVIEPFLVYKCGGSCTPSAGFLWRLIPTCFLLYPCFEFQRLFWPLYSAAAQKKFFYFFHSKGDNQKNRRSLNPFFTIHIQSKTSFFSLSIRIRLRCCQRTQCSQYRIRSYIRIREPLQFQTFWGLGYASPSICCQLPIPRVSSFVFQVWSYRVNISL